jgi:hypothetical protein
MCKLLPVVHGFLYGQLMPVLSYFPCFAYLVLRVRVENEDIHRLQLLNISVSLKFLSDLGSYGGDWHVEGVHLLDLWRLSRRQPLSLPTVFGPAIGRP